MKNAMINITTKATAAMLVAATVFTTVAPTVYAAENTAVVAEVQCAEQDFSVEADWLDDIVEEQREQNKKAVEEFDNSGWGRILDYIWDSIFG